MCVSCFLSFPLLCYIYMYLYTFYKMHIYIIYTYTYENITHWVYLVLLLCMYLRIDYLVLNKLLGYHPRKRLLLLSVFINDQQLLVSGREFWDFGTSTGIDITWTLFRHPYLWYFICAENLSYIRDTVPATNNLVTRSYSVVSSKMCPEFNCRIMLAICPEWNCVKLHKTIYQIWASTKQ